MRSILFVFLVSACTVASDHQVLPPNPVETCDQATHDCCTDHWQCSEAFDNNPMKSTCDVSVGQCRGCLSDAQCWEANDGRDYCLGDCHECLEDSHCGGVQTCQPGEAGFMVCRD